MAKTFFSFLRFLYVTLREKTCVIDIDPNFCHRPFLRPQTARRRTGPATTESLQAGALQLHAADRRPEGRANNAGEVLRQARRRLAPLPHPARLGPLPPLPLQPPLRRPAPQVPRLHPLDLGAGVPGQGAHDLLQLQVGAPLLPQGPAHLSDQGARGQRSERAESAVAHRADPPQEVGGRQAGRLARCGHEQQRSVIASSFFLFNYQIHYRVF